jgi:hypothetical protein
MWEPQPLATLRASTACTGITLPLLKTLLIIEHLLPVLIASNPVNRLENVFTWFHCVNYPKLLLTKIVN